MNNLIVGKITAVYGIKGWVKIYSFTDPMENVFNYEPWLLKIDGVIEDQLRLKPASVMVKV